MRKGNADRVEGEGGGKEKGECGLTSLDYTRVSFLHQCIYVCYIYSNSTHLPIGACLPGSVCLGHATQHQ